MQLKTDDPQWAKSPAAQILNQVYKFVVSFFDNMMIAIPLISQDPWRGTAFTWKVSGLMTLQMLPSVLPLFIFAFKFTLLQTMGILMPGMLLHGTVEFAILLVFRHLLYLFSHASFGRSACLECVAPKHARPA